MEELLASSYVWLFMLISHIYIYFLSYWPYLIYIPHLICLFTSFLQALNFVFSKIKMLSYCLSYLL